MWGIKTPAEAQAIIEKQKAEYNITEPKNLEEQALSLIGKDVYEKLIKGYTEKQWGRSCTELPAFIIKGCPFATLTITIISTIAGRAFPSAATQKS